MDYFVFCSVLLSICRALKCIPSGFKAVRVEDRQALAQQLPEALKRARKAEMEARFEIDTSKKTERKHNTLIV